MYTSGNTTAILAAAEIPQKPHSGAILLLAHKNIPNTGVRGIAIPRGNLQMLSRAAATPLGEQAFNLLVAHEV